MRKLYLFLILLLFTINPKAYPSHIYGGELLYQHISGNTYRVLLYIYGDCGTPNPPLLQDLNTSAPELIVLDLANGGGQIIKNLPIDTALSDKDVTPVCPQYINETKCVSPNGSLPGIKRYVYHDTITLPNTSTNWRFTFTGKLNANGQAGRTESITNLIFGSSIQTMYLVATLNNSTQPNSSPVYTAVPTPFYCLNIAQQYNQGASDPDGDSLTFQLVPGLTNGAPISYLSPFTPTAPLATSNFTYNNINGQMSFTPNVIQRPLVVNEVKEYKNGVLMGSSMREMTFIILDNCQNQAPDGDLNTTSTNINGGINQGNNVINVCAGTQQVSFDWSPTDPNQGDSITLTAYNLPTGSILNITGNNTTAPTASFSWDLTGVPNGIYTFYINYKDNGCPLNTNQTIAYTVQIANPYDISASVISPTECAHDAGIMINTSGGVLPRTVTIYSGTSVIKTFSDTSGLIIDSLDVGNYTIEVSSPYFSCSDSVALSVIHSGDYPFPPKATNATVCKGDSFSKVNIEFVPGATLFWYDEQGNQLPGEPTVNTNVPITYTWWVAQLVNVCRSASVPVSVTVNPTPEVVIPIVPATLCYADKVYLEAVGAKNYNWLPNDKVQQTGDGLYYAMVTTPTTFTVIGYDANTCRDTATITFGQIEQCCNFAYPNAFTPNMDGKNESFRPVMYGNMEEYELSVYNRFGERVYNGKDQQIGWDGRYKGQLCDVGMYFFKVKAKCYTGKKEENNGVVYLLR